MSKKTITIIYSIFAVSILVSVIYLLYDLSIINLGKNDEDENTFETNETVTPTKPPEQLIPIEQLSFAKDSYSIHIGEVTILEVIINPPVATTSTITWKSSDVLIADVDQNGHVIGMGEGTAVITAESDNGIIAETNISVVPSSVPIKELNQVKLSKNSMNIKVGESQTLQATISPNDATYRTLIWSSSNPSIVTVTDNGKIVAIREGSATITVKSSNGKSDSITIVVEKSSSPIIDVTSVSLSKKSIILGIGKSDTITASVNPQNATVQAITWTSSNSTVAKVDANGKVTAVSPGKATITATSSNGKTATLTVTVNESLIDVTSVVVTKDSVQLEVGSSATMTASVLPTNATNKIITWTSSNSTVAKVDANGKVTAVSPGKATITATSSNGKTASLIVTVNESLIDVTSVVVTKDSVQLEVGSSATMTASVLPTNATNKIITWTSSNSTVAKVDANGKVTAVSPGKATITATSSNGKTASLIVTVNESLIDVTSVVVTKDSVQLEVGSSATMTASVLPTNATNKKITWTSSNSTIAKVDANGKATAVSPGKATITATSNNGKKASIVVTVPVPPIDSKGRINNDYFHITPGENVGKSVAEKNSKGISEALKYASTKGIINVSLDKNTYVVANIVNTSDKNNNAAIEMASNVNLDLNNSVIQLYTNYDPKYSVIYFQNVKDASIRNGKIVGDRATHRCYSDGRLIDYYSASDEYKCGSGHGGSHEWGFGIKILASNNITVDDLSISYMTGDGIYTRIRGKHTGSYNTDDITITNNRISKCRRQGISIVSGSNIKIENNIIHNIRGTAPQLGIDLEPNQPFDIIKNVTIESNTIYDLGNSKSIGAVGRSGPIDNSSITIKNNKLSSCICIPNKSVKLSGNTKINNQGKTIGGNWNSNCPD